MKTLITLLLVCAILSNAFAADRPDATAYPMNDDSVTVINIQPYASTNQHLWDYSGRPFTRQFWFTLESSTNVFGPYQPVCTITGWCNNYQAITACYVDGAFVSCAHQQIQPEGQGWLDKCLAFIIGVGVVLYVGVRIAKYCQSMPPRTFDEGEGPTEPPATNSTSIIIPPEVANVHYYFIRIATP